MFSGRGRNGLFGNQVSKNVQPFFRAFDAFLLEYICRWPRNEQMLNYAKDGGPVVIWLFCSFTHDRLRGQIIGNVKKLWHLSLYPVDPNRDWEVNWGRTSSWTHRKHKHLKKLVWKSQLVGDMWNWKCKHVKFVIIFTFILFQQWSFVCLSKFSGSTQFLRKATFVFKPYASAFFLLCMQRPSTVKSRL